MKLKAIIQSSLTMAALGASVLSFASTQGALIQSDEKNFNFDWNDYATIAPNQAKIEKIEADLIKIDYGKLSPQDKLALGKLLYKLGTFYTHIAHKPDLAIAKMKVADHMLADKEATSWNANHLAYAYEQKFAASGNTKYKEKALDYTNIVISELNPNAANKEVAFAYCVKGLVFNDARDYSQAEASYRIALKIYEVIPDGRDDQYARAKNRLANIILDQNGRDRQALAMLKQLKRYWMAKNNVAQDPYAARNFIALGQAYLKLGKTQAAREEFESAIHIYKNVYGDNDAMLAKPYQLLAEANKILSNNELAATAKDKAAGLNKG